jgi:hypothetical protein
MQQEYSTLSRERWSFELDEGELESPSTPVSTSQPKTPHEIADLLLQKGIFIANTAIRTRGLSLGTKI